MTTKKDYPQKDYEHTMQILELKGKLVELQGTVQQLNHQMWKLEWHVNVEHKTEISELKRQNQKLLADRSLLANKIARMEASWKGGQSWSSEK